MEWIFPEQTKPLIDHLLSKSKVFGTPFFDNHSIDKLHPNTLLHDCSLAADVILEAIKNKKKIVIYGDYDVDGICATTTMWRFIYYDLGYQNVIPHVPNRFVEGYGLNPESIQKIVDEGGELIVTVDCGVKDIELVAEFSDRVDFVITDHHSPRPLTEPKSDIYKVSRENIYSSKAKAVVHPQLEEYPFKDICGAAVAWKLVRAMSEKIGNPELSEKYLQYAAIGTVGDIMPLIDENRSVVALGLKLINKSQIPGIEALLRVSSVAKGSVNSETLGYTLGPRLNASGRLDNAMIAVKLLSTNSKEYAFTLAEELDRLNAERQTLTKKYMSLAEQEYLKNPDTFVPIIVGEDWPEGIVGLIAGKLTEKYYKPFIIGSINGNTIKASARSIEEINITEVLNEHSTLLERFGGHAQAAGMSFETSKLDDLRVALNIYTKVLLNDSMPIRRLKIDAITSPDELDKETIKQMSVLEPFGNQNKKPLIALRSIPASTISKMGKDGKHCKFLYKGIEFVYFNFDKLPNDKTLYDIAGYVSVDTWNGKEKISFQVKYIREAL
jgi:single-stranded-DNA-specific exonuclease